jgi:hypothetical protein
MEIDLERGVDNRAELLVWRKGFLDPDLEKVFSLPTWPIDLITAMPLSDWDWSAQIGDGVKSSDSIDIFELTRSATGIAAPPKGNVAVTLSIREYTDHESRLGGFDWWKERSVNFNSHPNIADLLINKILQIMKMASSAGSELYVEQISILLSKDRSSPIASLVPTLHSDEFYGIRESAIFSLLEDGFNELGGALFLPTCRMDKLWDKRPIDLGKIMGELKEEPIITTGSGDILIFDGMIGLDGKKDTKNGVPHISPEIAGKSARLAVLMYHRRTQ